MRVRLLAKRYAVALFELALETKIQDKVQSDMLIVGDVLKENHLLVRVMQNPVIHASKKIKILDLLFKEKINPLTLKFLQLVTVKNRESYLIDICQSYSEVYKDYNNIMPVLLTTAYSAETDVKNRILNKLANIAHKKLEVTEQVDEKLIGGFTLQFMDYSYDASIKMQLKQLRKEFSENLYVKKF